MFNDPQCWVHVRHTSDAPLLLCIDCPSLATVSADSLAEDVLKRGDKDHDGTISFSEFSKFYSACLGSSEKKEHYVEKLEKRYGRAMGLTDDEIFG